LFDEMAELDVMTWHTLTNGREEGVVMALSEQ
jgi:hypothetical protein